ncbi:unnamed protein product [Rotaria socialis]|uniref:Ubiquitin-like protein NEDD8 n=1 Tax=Rotaria socialis TaxID=392032 RepID=A0A820Z2W4_9BILA|nr:unnamed protein product [Rotaria socialis]CAF4558415.1 unnamed protein product [Rotaria socialis]
MMIKVKTLTGREIEVDIDGTDKIERIKERVAEKEGIPPPQQRLIFGGKQMLDDKTVNEYNVTAASKSKALKGSLTTKNAVNASIDCTSPKYTDIEKRWIIYEGYLNYRYGQIKFLNLSQFAVYYVVLAKLPIARDKQIMVMYLYRNQKKKSSNVFQLDNYEKNLPTIRKWMKYVRQAFNYKNQNSISNNFSNVRQDLTLSWKDDLQNKDCIETDVIYNYQPFTQKQERDSPHLYTSSTSCYRPASSIQYEKFLRSNENNEIEIEQRHRFDSLQTEDNIYLCVKPTPSVFDEEHDKKNKCSISQPELQRTTERGLSTSTANDSFTWDDIFYTNDLNDYADILITSCQNGAFLVRPQSKKTNSNNHDYTLSIYTSGKVIKYKILSLPNKTYTLQNNKSQPCFVDIPHLCQYYTNHRLPCSTSGDDCTKGNFKNVYLTWPYTYYCHTNKY